jgi:hypothetical protein
MITWVRLDYAGLDRGAHVAAEPRRAARDSVCAADGAAGDLRSLYIFIVFYRWFLALREVLPSLTRLTSPAGARNNLIGAASRSLGCLTRLCLLGTSFANTGDVWTDVHSDYELPSTQLRVLIAKQPLHWWSSSGLLSVTELLLDATDYNRPSCHGLLSMTDLSRSEITDLAGKPVGREPHAGSRRCGRCTWISALGQAHDTSCVSPIRDGGSGGSVSVARVFPSYNRLAHSRTRSSTVESRVCAVYSSDLT